MKEELNIAAILKDKPKGTKLWSDMCGESSILSVTDDNIKLIDEERCTSNYDEYGKWHPNGLCMLYPNRNMRDWSKFAWKKGDVLKYRNYKSFFIFAGWANENYTRFTGIDFKYGQLHISHDAVTMNHNKATPDEAKEFFSELEKACGGKLDLETLEIEKQPEFKDGDILFYESRIDNVPNNIFILRGSKQPIPFCNYYACLDSDGFVISKNCTFTMYNKDFRLATDSEKQQLFNALAKEGKAWDKDKKVLVDLPKKCEFKPMDWCLMRFRHRVWNLCQFAFINKSLLDNPVAVGGNVYEECIPYNDQTKHLLGTTDEWKGGEG